MKKCLVKVVWNDISSHEDDMEEYSNLKNLLLETTSYGRLAAEDEDVMVIEYYRCQDAREFIAIPKSVIKKVIRYEM